MPYNSIQEAKDAGFPTSAEEVDLSLSQINKLADLYDAIKKAGTADNPMAVAWTSFKQLYKKEGDKWVEIEKKEQLKQLAIIANAEFLSIESHNAILQTLERWIPGYAQGKGKEGAIFYSREPFERNIADWNGIDLIFAEQHPNMVLYAKNPAQALKEIDGKVVGKLSNARIEVAGHPRQMGEVEINDKEAQSLYEEGKLSLSTGFFCPVNTDFELEGELTPNHVLLFREDENNLPKDKGAFILNKEEMANIGKVISAKNETEFKAIMDKLWGFFRNLTTGKVKKEVENQERNNLEEKEMEKVEELTSKLDTANKELANKTSEFETATKAHEDEVKGLKGRIAEFEQKEADKTKVERDAQFEQVIAKLPPGMTHKEEDKTTLRSKFDNDPTALMAELVSLEHKEGTTEEGDEFEQKVKEDVAAIKELKEDTGRI